MVVDTETFSHLVGTIYDAAIEPALWPDTLGQAAKFVGGSGAALYTKNLVDKSADFGCSWGIDAHYSRSYFDTYVKFDPITIGQFLLEVEQVHSNGDLISRAEFLDSRFCKEWIQPQGWADHMGALLDKSATNIALFSVLRHTRQGPADGAARRRMQLIVPHVRRAALVGNLLDLHKSTAAALADTLGGLAAGVILVDAAGRIVFANVAGEAILEDGTVLRRARDRVVALEASANRTLQEVFADAAGCDAAIGVRGIAVPLSVAPQDRWLAHVLPLTSGARRQAGLSYRAVAALFVRKAELDAASPMATVAKLYKLTPSELRVLGAVVEAGGVPAVAEALGISEATAKTHLQHVFEKTGLRRQLDLVKLVAGHASPIDRPADRRQLTAA